MLLATGACNFSSSELQKELRDRQFFNILTMKFGQWRRDCNKLNEDQKHNRVRQIEEVDAGSQSSNATTSIVRLVSISPVIQEHPIDRDDSYENLTLHFTISDQVSSRCIRVLSMGVLKPKLPDECSGQNLSTFDLTYSDDNADWTSCNSPTWSLSNCDENLPQDASTPAEIILDSGADVSALPRSYGNVGVEVGQHEAQFIDAQGSPLHVHSTRVAKVTFGDVTLKERFIVTDVSIPILALGHLVRAGWSLQSNGQEQYLLKGHSLSRLDSREVRCVQWVVSI